MLKRKLLDNFPDIASPLGAVMSQNASRNISTLQGNSLSPKTPSLKNADKVSLVPVDSQLAPTLEREPSFHEIPRRST